VRGREDEKRIGREYHSLQVYEAGGGRGWVVRGVRCEGSEVCESACDDPYVDWTCEKVEISPY
jgi:hypothetical protein